ncbi:hypothetical protein [Microlunatus speluncae]|uniref:hypothetical protein n=1 Tax=Microlunatus speluncae TaxID=2594267 RepID=UPI0012666A63|nr:hypothetical protein [Microlunatus speluncae]
MALGLRIAGSVFAAAALSLIVIPGATAEPQDEPGLPVGSRLVRPADDRAPAPAPAPPRDALARRGDAVIISCEGQYKAPNLSKADIDRIMERQKVQLSQPGLTCKIISAVPGDN